MRITVSAFAVVLAACAPTQHASNSPDDSLAWQQEQLATQWALHMAGRDTGVRVDARPRASAFAEVVDLNEGRRFACPDVGTCKTMAEGYALGKR
jgi:hypothetical protein